MEDELKEAVRFLLSFIPEEAQEVPENLCPTFYITGSEEGDREIMAKVKKIRELIAT